MTVTTEQLMRLLCAVRLHDWEGFTEHDDDEGGWWIKKRCKRCGFDKPVSRRDFKRMFCKKVWHLQDRNPSSDTFGNVYRARGGQ